MAARAYARRGEGPERERRAQDLVCIPRYTRAEILTFTLPRMSSRAVEMWVSRGLLDWNPQYAFGDADRIRAVADANAENVALGKRRLYTGGDILKLMVLQALSQAGLPLSHGEDIIPATLERAAHLAMGGDARRRFVILVVSDDAGGHELHAGDLADLATVATTWRTIIDVDELVTRYLRGVDHDI